MKKTALMAIVLIAIATIFSFSAVSADKPEVLPAEGPFDEIYAMVLDIITHVNVLQMSMDDNFTDVDSVLEGLQTDVNTFQADVVDNFTDVDSALDGLQTDVTQIKSDVATPEFIMYTSGSFATPYRGAGPGIPPGALVLMSPSLDETLNIEVKTWEMDEGAGTFTNTMVCGDEGYVTLDSGNKMSVCPFWQNSTYYVIQIIVPENQREKVSFYAFVSSGEDYSRMYEPGDFKVDPIY